MTYEIYRTNGDFVAAVADQSVNSDALPITLLGQGKLGYGVAWNQNLVYMLENFADPVAPTDSLSGQFWYNSSAQVMNYCNNSNQWVPMATVAEFSAYWSKSELTNLSQLKNDVSYITAATGVQYAPMSGSRSFDTVDYNALTTIYETRFVNQSGSTNGPAALSGNGYYFGMGGGGIGFRGFQIVGDGTNNLHWRNLENTSALWSSAWHSNNFDPTTKVDKGPLIEAVSSSAQVDPTMAVVTTGFGGGGMQYQPLGDYLVIGKFDVDGTLTGYPLRLTLNSQSNGSNWLTEIFGDTHIAGALNVYSTISAVGMKNAAGEQQQALYGVGSTVLDGGQCSTSQTTLTVYAPGTAATTQTSALVVNGTSLFEGTNTSPSIPAMTVHAPTSTSNGVTTRATALSTEGDVAVGGGVAATGNVAVGNNLSCAGNANILGTISLGDATGFSGADGGGAANVRTPTDNSLPGVYLGGGAISCYNPIAASGWFGSASGGSNQDICIYYFNGVIVGTVAVQNGGVVFGSTSDYRTKENIEQIDAADAEARLRRLRPTQFSYLSDETATRHQGFIAHEVAEVYPYAVIGDKDGADHQKLDPSKGLPADLTSVVLKLLDEVADLKKQIAALRS